MDKNIDVQVILSVAEQLSGVYGEDAKNDVSYAGIKEQTVQLLRYLKSAMYPNVFHASALDMSETMDDSAKSLQKAYETLCGLLKRIMPENAQTQSLALALMQELPQIKSVLETDVQAAYEGDPAAKNKEEVMLAYPAFEAISSYRIAHKLFTMGVPILPRMITEYAHQITGIDIHPGATIGKHFFIDHGTGVVIGETTTIGDHVKLYQGVTLGAKSFEVGEDGTLVKGIKRHPDIGNHVVIYSGATILGGQTVIGDHCVIGGNVWLTRSVKAGETILAAHGRMEQKASI